MEVLDWIIVAIGTLLGFGTHIGKKMIEEKLATGHAPHIKSYFKNNALEIGVTTMAVIGALFVGYVLNDLSGYSAYSWGIAGGSLAGASGGAAKQMIARAVNRGTGDPP